MFVSDDDDDDVNSALWFQSFYSPISWLYVYPSKKNPVPIDEVDDMMMFMIPIRVVIKMTVGKLVVSGGLG